MKILSFGVFIFALTFCGLSDRLKNLAGKSETNTTTTTTSNSTSSSNTSTSSSGDKAEKASLTSEQQAAIDGGQETKWADQGITWTLPKGWKKMSQSKESFNYSSPDLAFLLASISVMPDNFPSETSLKATYDSAIQQIKNGKYENARYLEIDGVKGVEFIETMPEDKTGARRHQWIAFRNYLGQNQQLNIMLSTKGSNFDKHRNDFAGVIYSMKIQK